MIDRRALLLSGLLCAGGAGAMAVHPAFLRTGKSTRADRIDLPQRFGQWAPLPADRVVLPPADALTEAAYQQLSVRAYSDGSGPAIITLVAYGAVQTHALQLHRPETCYPSSGFQILGQDETDLELGGHLVHATWMAAQRGTRSDRLLYWTRIGQRFTTDIWDQRLAMAQYALQGAPTDGVLVRLSVEAVATPKTDARILSFLRDWVVALDKVDQSLLLGSPV